MRHLSLRRRFARHSKRMLARKSAAVHKIVREKNYVRGYKSEANVKLTQYF